MKDWNKMPLWCKIVCVGFGALLLWTLASYVGVILKIKFIPNFFELIVRS